MNERFNEHNRKILQVCAIFCRVLQTFSGFCNLHVFAASILLYFMCEDGLTVLTLR